VGARPPSGLFIRASLAARALNLRPYFTTSFFAYTNCCSANVSALPAGSVVAVGARVHRFLKPWHFWLHSVRICRNDGLGNQPFERRSCVAVWKTAPSDWEGRARDGGQRPVSVTSSIRVRDLRRPLCGAPLRNNHAHRLLSEFVPRAPGRLRGAVRARPPGAAALCLFAKPQK